MRALILFLSLPLFAAGPSTTTKLPSMKFDDQLVEGQVYRPDFSVVTGDLSNRGTGVLRIRKDFQDRLKEEQQETKRDDSSIQDKNEVSE